MRKDPARKRKLEKWRGPVTSSLTWHQIEDPAKKRKLEKWRGPVTSSLSGFRREDPARIKICFLDIATNR